MGGVFSGGNKTELDIDNTVEMISNTLINISQSFSSSTNNIQSITLDCTDPAYLTWLTDCQQTAMESGYSAADIVTICPPCSVNDISMESSIFITITASQLTDLQTDIENDFEAKFEESLSQSNDALVTIGNSLEEHVENLSSEITTISADICNEILSVCESEQSLDLNGGVATGISMVSVVSAITDIIQNNQAMMSTANDITTDYNNQLSQSNGIDLSGIIYIILIVIACGLFGAVVLFIVRKCNMN